MYSDSESDDEQIRPVNKSDSDFDFIAQEDENDGELNFDAQNCHCLKAVLWVARVSLWR